MTVPTGPGGARERMARERARTQANPAYVDMLARALRRQRRSRIRKAAAAAGLVIAVLAVIIGVWLLSSLYLMLGVGIAHLDWWHTMPPMSYQTALLIDIFIGGFIGLQTVFQRSGRKK